MVLDIMNGFHHEKTDQYLPHWGTVGDQKWFIDDSSHVAIHTLVPHT